MRSCSIAIVDDNEAERYILKRHLSSLRENVDFLEFESGEEIFQFMVEDGPTGRVVPLAKFPPQLIILDINMPVMGGYEFLDAFEAHLKKDSSFSTVIILMLSSSDRGDDIKRAMSHSLVKDYFVKGKLTGEELVERIKGYLHLKDQ